MRSEELFVMVLLIAIAAGVFIVVMAMRQRGQHMERLHRERMAMIDRGLVPNPEMIPAPAAMRGKARQTGLEGRQLTAGVVVVGLGLGFMTLIGVAAGEPDVAMGLGGAIVILGVSLIVVSLLKRNAGVDSVLEPSSPAVRPPSDFGRPTDAA